MDIKVLAFDMDGTLLNDKEFISNESISALNEAQKRGIRLVLASGTHTNVLAKFAKQLNMDFYGGYLIGANGALLMEYPSLKLIHHHTIEVKEVQRLFDFGLSNNVEVLAFKDDTIIDAIPEVLLPLKEEYRKLNHLCKEYPNTAGLKSLVHDQSIRYPNIIYTQDYLESYGQVNKVCFANEVKDMDEFIPKLKDEFGDQFTISRTSNRWTECTHLNINKGLALKEVMKILNVDRSSVVAFGDGENDIPLFAVCDYGVAMENAMKCLKDVAYMITDSNENEGVSKTLQKLKII